MTDKIIRVKIDAGDSASQINQLDKSMVGLGQSADKATSEIEQLNGINTQTTKTAQAVNQALGGTSQGLAGFGRQAGQAGIQLQQFVGQVQGGVSPLVALSQQAADLGYVLGFPLLGAVVGIAAAIGGPLISSFITAGNESDKLKEKLDGIQKTLSDLDAESKKAFTQVELGRISVEYDKQREKVDALRQEAKRLNEELKGASGQTQERLAVQLTNTNEAIRKAEEGLKGYSKQLDDTARIINESLVEGQNDAVDKTKNLTQQLELQQIALKQGELAALLQAAAWQTGAESVQALDENIKSLIVSNYELEKSKKAQEEAQRALNSEIQKEAELNARQAERAQRDQRRIDQRIANIQLETETLSSASVLQKAVRDEIFTQEQADLAAQTSARILAATTEYQQLIELKNISDQQKIEAEIAYREQLAAIDEQYKVRSDDLEIARQMMATETAQRVRDANLQAMASGVSILETFLGRSNAIVKAARLAMGAYQAFSIYASSQAAAAAALAPPPLGLGPIAGAGLAGAISLSGKVSAAAVLASAAASTFSSSGGGSYGGGSSSVASSAALPATPQAAPNVGAFEVRGLAQLSEQLSRLDNDDVLPVSFTKRLVASLDSVQRLQGA